MQNYYPNWFILLGALVILSSAFFCFLHFSEYYNVAFLGMEREYPFGSEGPVAGVWHYESEKNYKQYNLIGSCLFFLNVLTVLIAFLKNNNRIMRFGILFFILLISGSIFL